jgi:hypothetical protein
MDLARARADLRKAKTEEAVFALVQQHLAGLEEADLASLPDGLRAHLLRTADDISRWALYFNREDLSLPPEVVAGTLVHELRALFTAAAWRLADLAHRKRYGAPEEKAP